ncbi:MAG: hypothetical protein LBK04_07705 [Clostridiales Family XIII bacterium]|jgi:hypothetical protein|nr:hypothetical protein [Clostridiales Family XIII bacterium]
MITTKEKIFPETGQEKREGEKRKWIIRIAIMFLTLVLLLLLLHQLGVFKFPWEKPAGIIAGDLFPGQGDAEDGHLPGMTPAQIKEQMQKAADDSYFSFKINARPEFDNGKAMGNLGIENPSFNVYPMVVQIFLDDTGEMVYDSGGILPDQYIDNAKLSVPLKAGDYKATAYLNAYDPETKAWQGKQAAALIITVHN